MAEGLLQRPRAGCYSLTRCEGCPCKVEDGEMCVCKAAAQCRLSEPIGQHKASVPIGGQSNAEWKPEWNEKGILAEGQGQAGRGLPCSKVPCTGVPAWVS